MHEFAVRRVQKWEYRGVQIFGHFKYIPKCWLNPDLMNFFVRCSYILIFSINWMEHSFLTKIERWLSGSFLSISPNTYWPITEFKPSRSILQPWPHVLKIITWRLLPITIRPTTKWEGSTKQSVHASNTRSQSIKLIGTNMSSPWHTHTKCRYTDWLAGTHSACTVSSSTCPSSCKPGHHNNRWHDRTATAAKILQSGSVSDGRLT